MYACAKNCKDNKYTTFVMYVNFILNVIILSTTHIAYPVHRSSFPNPLILIFVNLYMYIILTCFQDIHLVVFPIGRKWIFDMSIVMIHAFEY